jgi:hypothetical protein
MIRCSNFQYRKRNFFFFFAFGKETIVFSKDEKTPELRKELRNAKNRKCITQSPLKSERKLSYRNSDIYDNVRLLNCFSTSNMCVGVLFCFRLFPNLRGDECKNDARTNSDEVQNRDSPCWYQCTKSSISWKKDACSSFKKQQNFNNSVRIFDPDVYIIVT